MPARGVIRKPATIQYSVLAVLLLITAAYQMRRTHFILDYIQGRVIAVQPPGDLKSDRPVVTDVEPEAARAGLQKGDTLLAVDGRPLESETQIVRDIEYARPADKLELTVRHPNGNIQNLSISLVERKHSASDNWLFALALHVVLPLACVALGFTVAFLRPREPMAWILLALLLGFSQIFGITMEDADGTLASNLAIIFKAAFSSTWTVWLLLLGIYFPERLDFERRHGWIKYLAIVPLLLIAVFGLAALVASLQGYAGFAVLDRIIPAALSPRLTMLIGSIIVASIAGFFVLIVAKYFVASTPDAKRRLRLLYGGLFFAMMPTLALVVASGVLNKGLDQFPAWIELPCLLLTLLFPVTLAYIIVAYRAMDIQVVVRQGLRYTLARRGVGVLQALVTALLVLVMAHLAQVHQATPNDSLLIIGIGIAIIFLLGRGAQHTGQWIDRRFFRDSYNAEQVLMELGEQVRTVVEMRPLLEMVSRKVSESLHVPQVAVLLGGVQYRLAYAQGFDEAMQVEFGDHSATVRQLLQEQRPTRVYLDDPGNWVNRELQVPDEERSMLQRMRSELLVPLQAAGRLLGFISLGQKRSEEPYSRTDLQLLGSVAAQTGLALENARLTSAVAEEAAQREAMKREVEIAREVQERLFPQNLPKIDGLDYCGLCRPARGVGGDYYDFLPLPGGELGVAIGDVAGKGISAALMMASLQASLRGQTMTGPDDLAGVVGRVNRLVYDVSSPERYATFFFARYDPRTRKLTYVNAGHNPPMLLRRRDGQWQLQRLEQGGTVVGLFPHFDYTQDSVELAPGDLLAAYTDGISEAMNEREEEWGEDQLLAVLKQCSSLSAADTIARIMDAADSFTAGAKQYDDMTMVVLKVAAIN
jgi:sigma-B regulation protein RsbU (phosphoserine phosphatase)